MPTVSFLGKVIKNSHIILKVLNRVDAYALEIHYIIMDLLLERSTFPLALGLCSLDVIMLTLQQLHN